MSCNPPKNNAKPNNNYFKQQSSDSLKYKNLETMIALVKGACVGMITVSLVAPGLYAKNRVMSGEKIIRKDSFKGVGGSALNIVPATIIQFTVYSVMVRTLFPNKHESKLTFSEKLLCSCTAGFFSGIGTVFGETLVQNVQKQGRKSMMDVVKQIHNKGGIKSFTHGALANGAREKVWAVSYFALAPFFSKLFESKVENETLRDVLGAGFSGFIAGILTNPLDYLRVQKQKNVMYQLTPKSYKQFISEAGVSGLFKGWKQRSISVSFACVIMTQGKKIADCYT